MSIEQLKKILESERNEMANRAWGFEGTSIREAGYYKRGHEAATNRLLPLLEMYEKTLTAIDWRIREMQNEKIISMAEMCRALKVISDNYKPKEFLSELTKMVEIKKESGK